MIGFVAFLSIVMAFGVEAILPAFDQIDAEFGFAARDVSISLLVTTLLVGMGVGQVVWGPVSDRFGRVPVLLAGFGLYAVGAMGMIFAPNLEVILITRFVWGLGAAAPNGLRFALARDLYSGDQMARVVTFATAVFLIGPVVMPFIGEAILLVGPWQLIAGSAILLAAFASAITLWFGETLDGANRRPLRFGPLGSALRQISQTRSSTMAILTAMFFTASFFVFLGSAQPVIENIYGRGDIFVWLFGTSGISMSVALFGNGRMIRRFGTRRVVWWAAMLFLTVGTVALLLTLAADGVPPLAVWLLWACAANATGVIVGSLSASLALDPLGNMAGTGASILAFAQLGPGAALAAIVDSQIDGTVTPMMVGSLVYGVLGAVLLRIALRNALPTTAASNSPLPTTRER